MNTLLYIGMAFIIVGFVGFIISVIMERHYKIKLWKHEQLHKSFKNADKTNERTYNDC